MANKSTAKGSFIIEANSIETIEKLYYLMKYLENEEYDTTFSYNFDKRFTIKNCIAITEKRKCEFATPFEGTGRWFYQNNIKDMAKWIKEAVERKNDDLGREYIRDLKNEEYEITFDYVDYECGAQIFDLDIVTLIHREGDDFDNNGLWIEKEKELERTLYNLMYHLQLNLDDAIQELYDAIYSRDFGESALADLIIELDNDRDKIIDISFDKANLNRKIDGIIEAAKDTIRGL